MLAHWPRDVLAASLTAPVGAGYPGAGRRVYPAMFQLLAYGMASPQLYADVQHGLLGELTAGQAGAFGRQHADLHSLLDVPAELFLAMLDWVRDRSPWAEGGPLIGGSRHDLAPLQGVPVLTVEAGRDELIGPGQTHSLTRRLGWARAMSVTRAQRATSRPVHRSGLHGWSGPRVAAFLQRARALTDGAKPRPWRRLAKLLPVDAEW